MQETIARHFEPGTKAAFATSIVLFSRLELKHCIYAYTKSLSSIGDTRSTSHRLSDAPDSARSLFQNELDEDKEPGGGKSFMDTVHEYVAKALGGGSRGEFRLWLGLPKSFLLI